MLKAGLQPSIRVSGRPITKTWYCPFHAIPLKLLWSRIPPKRFPPWGHGLLLYRPLRSRVESQLNQIFSRCAEAGSTEQSQSDRRVLLRPRSYSNAHDTDCETSRNQVQDYIQPVLGRKEQVKWSLAVPVSIAGGPSQRSDRRKPSQGLEEVWEQGGLCFDF